LLGAAALTAAALMAPLAAQQRGRPAAALTAADYARAEKFMTWNAAPLVYRAGVRPTWIDGDRFWYRVTTAAGSEAVLVDPASGTKSPCTLPACAAAPAGTGRAGRGGAGATAAPTTVPSPDGKRVAFIRDWNLWVREGGRETPLTTDGVKDYGYATDNAGWSKSDRPILVWSPDSKKIATFQQDQRRVGESSRPGSTRCLATTWCRRSNA
jgi:dipeptidyl peptidase IV (DPP IV)-like protein